MSTCKIPKTGVVKIVDDAIVQSLADHPERLLVRVTHVANNSTDFMDRVHEIDIYVEYCGFPL